MEEPPSTRELPNWEDWGQLYAAELDEPVGPAMPGGNLVEMIGPACKDLPVVLKKNDGTWHPDALEQARLTRAYGAVEVQRLVLQEAVLASPAGRAERFWEVGRAVAAGRVLRRLVRKRLGEELEGMAFRRWRRDRERLEAMDEELACPKCGTAIPATGMSSSYGSGPNPEAQPSFEHITCPNCDTALRRPTADGGGQWQLADPHDP